MVEVLGASVRAGGTEILRGVDATFRPEAFTVILGPNGAGKSTLMRVATGLLRPTTGVVTYGGVDAQELGSEKLSRRRAVLSQHVELAFALPAREVVMMGRYPWFGRAPTPLDRAVVDEAIAMVGMEHKATQLYPTLSGGEQQKVQLARVLAQIWTAEDAREPRVLFLDEPTTSLDVHFQIHLLDIARSLTNRRCTVVAILHDVNVAFQYGDVFLVMDDGRVVHEADHAAGVPPSLLEEVFRVRAHRVTDEVDGRALWRFTL